MGQGPDFSLSACDSPPLPVRVRVCCSASDHLAVCVPSLASCECAWCSPASAGSVHRVLAPSDETPLARHHLGSPPALSPQGSLPSSKRIIRTSSVSGYHLIGADLCKEGSLRGRGRGLGRSRIDFPTTFRDTRSPRLPVFCRFLPPHFSFISAFMMASKVLCDVSTASTQSLIWTVSPDQRGTVCWRGAECARLRVAPAFYRPSRCSPCPHRETTRPSPLLAEPKLTSLPFCVIVLSGHLLQ